MPRTRSKMVILDALAITSGAVPGSGLLWLSGFGRVVEETGIVATAALIDDRRPPIHWL